ncbi:hypothetical protein NERG_01537 [Nematocida ausubeli]|uniref:Uncharacterized protein n=1 Tax=Nematocida ausubeli (strain ATCC PRA-371 / ERTm2) TaxID=1913371 RepID=H8ZD66_NEMA1|nr:hypothetical protein NERG_01537 [Nematocida ausubeli]
MQITSMQTHSSGLVTPRNNTPRAIYTSKTSILSFFITFSPQLSSLIFQANAPFTKEQNRNVHSTCTNYKYLVNLLVNYGNLSYSLPPNVYDQAVRCSIMPIMQLWL